MHNYGMAFTIFNIFLPKWLLWLVIPINRYLWKEKYLLEKKKYLLLGQSENRGQAKVLAALLW